MKYIFSLSLIWLSSILCVAQNIPYGKNRFTLISENVEREYYVHIPLSYDGSTPVPVVFMLHGTGGDGEEFYNRFGWKELSEKENFIAVFPSSLRYKIIDELDGPKTITKWNTPPDAGWIFQPGEVGKDDILYLRKVIADLQNKFKINSKRIYLSGFSNGGNMAAKCSIELSDLLAAVCQSASSFNLDTTYIPKRKLPVLFQVGDRDYGPGNEGPPVAMYLFDTLISIPNLPYLNGKHYRIANLHQRHFELENKYTMTGDSSMALVATYLPKTNTAKKGFEFKYIFIKNLDHEYPNGKNHPYNSPVLQWNWMKQYTLDGNAVSTHALSVINGYGSGTYATGDTIHIWGSEPQNNKTFNTWNGNTETLEEKTNWHTTLLMPDKDITVSAEYINLPSELNYKGEMIQGPYSKKEVFTYFPPKNKLKGVAWFFAGSGGYGRYWVIRTEERKLLDLLATSGYAIITSDAEEVTQNKDLNQNGSFGHQYVLDTVKNEDLVNIKFLKNYLLAQGKYDVSTPHIAIGFSAGGAFAEIVAGVYRWAGSLSHNTRVSDFFASNGSIAHYQNNSLNDDGPNVGMEGNVKAAENMLKYQNRKVFNQWILQKPQPLHPERFSRIEGVTSEQSLGIFNYVKQTGLLDSKNYLKTSPTPIQDDYEAHPTKYPALQAFPSALVMEAFIQLKAVYTTHLFRSDYNGSALKFIKQITGVVTAVSDKNDETKSAKLFFPNPARDFIRFDKNSSYSIYDFQGRKIKSGNADGADLYELGSGSYVIKIGNRAGKLVVMK